MSRDLTQRLLVAAVGIPVLLFVFYVGKLYLLVFLGIVVLLGAWEYAKILNDKKSARIILNAILCLAFYFLTAIPENLFLPRYTMDIIALAYVLLSPILGIIRKKPAQKLTDYLLTNFGWIYMGYFSGLIYRLDTEHYELKLLLLLLVLIWITDSAAYFIGMKFGRHRGIFSVSPNKSLEGFIAGLIVPFLICGVLYFVFDIWSLKQLAFISVSAGLVGQIGDLFESKIKRTGGVKDSSSLFPGHGGVLDRIDSLLFAGPFLYMLLKLIP